MKFKSIIFDLDGTIIDTNHIWDKATKDLIRNKGIQLTLENHSELSKELKGIAIPQSCAIIKERFDLEHSLEELMHEKRTLANNLYLEGLQFIEGFEDFHKRVLAHNLLVGVATNAENHTLATAIEQLKLRDYFNEHIYNFTYVEKPKPAPDVFLYTAKQLGIDPADCVVIEDSPHGIDAAKSAGMFCIGINTAKNRAALHKADLVVEHYDEIDLPRLLKINSKK